MVKLDDETIFNVYNEFDEKYGGSAYKHMSKILEILKEKHREQWDQDPKRDFDQSWRAVKGRLLERLIMYIIESKVEKMGLKVINGNSLNSKNLSNTHDHIKRHLVIDYGAFGMHLPDVDLVIYDPKTLAIIAVLSIKVTLRERITQTAYWKLKLEGNATTQNVKVFFVSPDEDGTLTNNAPTKKGRAIVETDLDGSYVLTEQSIEESEKVKLFEHFFTDLNNLVNGS